MTYAVACFVTWVRLFGRERRGGWADRVSHSPAADTSSGAPASSPRPAPPGPAAGAVPGHVDVAATWPQGRAGEQPAGPAAAARTTRHCVNDPGYRGPLSTCSRGFSSVLAGGAVLAGRLMRKRLVLRRPR